MSSSWETAVADKKQRLDNAIPQEWRLKTKPDAVNVMDMPINSGILTPGEIQITESSAVELVRQLARGELTATAVTVAFCKRAALAQQLVRNSFQSTQYHTIANL